MMKQPSVKGHHDLVSFVNTSSTVCVAIIRSSLKTLVRLPVCLFTAITCLSVGIDKTIENAFISYLKRVSVEILKPI